MRLQLLILFLFISCSGIAQKDTMFLDIFLSNCERSEALYYAFYTPTNSTSFKEEIFYLTSHKPLSIGYSKERSVHKRDGFYTEYYENGNKKSEGNYKDHFHDGFWKHYYSDTASLHYTMSWKQGTPNGELRSYYREGQLKRTEQHNNNFEASKGNCFDKDGNKIPFTPFTKMPQFTEDINRFLAKNTRYPKNSRKNNESGRAIVRFIIESTGEVSHIKIGRPLFPDLDAEAMRLVAKMPKWNPGTEDDVAVSVPFTLPIVFRLE
jgi:TonB family protein